MSRGLIIFPGALGDLLCLLPAIRALARSAPSVGFELMARGELADFAVGRMGIVAAHSIDRQEVAQLFAETTSRDAGVYFAQFQRIDCFFASESALFCRALRDATGANVHFYPFRPPGEGHMAECYLRAIGLPAIGPVRYSVELLPDDQRRADRRLRALGLERGGFNLVLPGSGSAKKNWPAPNYAVLANLMAAGGSVVVLLGPAEKELEPMFAACHLPLLTELDLGEVAGVARVARGYVGNDSGVSHLAAAAGARGVVIFGPTSPERWAPLGEVRIIRRASLPSLSPGEVWSVINGLAEV